MDRIIKFRGKPIKTNEWVYGNYIFIENDIFQHKIIESTSLILDIDIKTLGQFTGLYDKNGKEIYTSDIVKITEKENISKHKIIPMRPIIAEIAWSDEYLAYILITTSIKDAFENLGDYLDYEIEVIGNIYDNKNLLEGQ